MKKIFLVFLLALVLRLSLVFVAHHGDLNNNISWGNIALERGLNGYYEGAAWPYSNPNQPPLTILAFAATSYIWKSVENVSWLLNNRFKVFPSTFIWFWEGKGVDLMVKLPGIIADLVIGYFIYKFLKERNDKRAVFIASVWLFNPIVWYNSAVWGQTDSIVNLLGFLSTIFLIRKDLVKSLVFLTLSVLFKGSLALFIPVIIIYAFFQKYSFKRWFISILSSLAAAVFASIWFHPKWDLFIWLFNLYKNRIFPGEIGYLTANSFNFWWLVNSGKVLDSTLYLGISARMWGIVVILISFTVLALYLWKKQSEKRLLISLVVISLVSFLFMTRIHERYLYPFFIPATVLLGSVSGLIIPYVIFSFTHLLNLYHLFWAPGIPVLEKFYLNPAVPNIISLVNLAVFFWLLLSFYKLQKKDN
jgi:dolichyl-phosphate-mannose-protein mannosyltransferase